MKQENDIFISYSRKDTEVVNAVIAQLEANGYSVWVDRDGIESGDAFKTIIVDAIENSKCILFFSSQASNSSPWTAKEINISVETKKPIIPIRLDNTVYDKSVRFDLSGLDYVDMTDESKKDAALEKLLRSLSVFINKSNNDVSQKRAILTFTTDADCELYMDGEKIANLKTGQSLPVNTKIGEHNFKIISKDYTKVKDNLKIDVTSDLCNEPINIVLGKKIEEHLLNLEKKKEQETMRQKENLIWHENLFGFISAMDVLIMLGYIGGLIIYKTQFVSHPWWVFWAIILYFVSLGMIGYSKRQVGACIYLCAKLFIIANILDYTIDINSIVNSWHVSCLLVYLVLILLSLTTKSGRWELWQLLTKG